jgi:hypothetical protein
MKDIKIMTTHVIETVVFKLLANISDMDFLETVPASSTFIEAASGFVARRLSRGEDGTWIEHIEWNTMDDAKLASDTLMKEESVMSFLQCIDVDSVSIWHTHLEVTLG